MAADRSERLGPYRALEHTFVLEVSRSPLAAWCRKALRPMELPTGTAVPYRYRVIARPGDTWCLFSQAVELGHHLPAQQVLPRLLVDFNRQAAASTTGHLVLHAGVVGVRDGVVVLAAASGSGKTTLVATAGRAGHAYGGDEHAAIRFDNHLVQPIPKPLALKTGSRGLFPEHRLPATSPMSPFFGDQLFIPPDALPGGILFDDTPIRAVVFPIYEEGAQTTIEQVDPARTVMLLRENAFNFPVDAARSFLALAAVARSSPAYRLRFGDAASAWAGLTPYVA